MYLRPPGLLKNYKDELLGNQGPIQWRHAVKDALRGPRVPGDLRIKKGSPLGQQKGPFFEKRAPLGKKGEQTT